MTKPITRAPRTDQRERVLKTAAKLFAKNGYHGTGVAEIGRAVSLGRGGLYHHMGSKEDLLREICVRHVRVMIAIGEEVLESDATPPEKVRELSRGLMRTIYDHLPEVTVVFRELDSLTGDSRAEVVAMRKRFEEIWVKLLEQGVEEGYFRPVDPVVAKGLIGLHNSSYVWIKSGGRLSPDEIADVYCDMVLPGLVAGGTP